MMNGIDTLAKLGNTLLETGVLTDSVDLKKVNQIYEKGFSLLQASHYEAAKKHFQIVTKLCPIHHLGLIGLGICHYETQAFDLAKRCFEVVDFLQVQHPIAALYKGYLDLEVGEKSKAIKNFEKSLTLLDEKDPNFRKAAVLLNRLKDEY